MSTDAVISNINKLPKIRKIVQDLINGFDDDELDLEYIAQQISLDPVISIKVLRLANTARFGGARTIASMDEAVVRLGYNTVRTLVIASGMASMTKSIPGFDLKAFWTRSFQVATISKELARPAKLNPDVAFTCGMMYDIGSVLLAYTEVETPHIDTTGVSSAQVGATLAETWNFPDDIVSAIEAQGSSVGKNSQGFPALVYFSAALVDCLATEPDCEENEELNRLLGSILTLRLGVAPDKVTEQLPDLMTAGAEFASSIAD
ncbi:HDOD domain-containing protein [Aliagarivorans marinus]|uniref:HDOD domain-containing protein n=1 Tax=Aliagarivorans marinus TaxID=561965 RepID=UPI0003FA5DCB|nr:HDOD domain-containing protein [Aliagarivorans marinus]